MPTDWTQFLSPAQAAEALGVDRSTVWRWYRSHPELAVRIGDRWRIKPGVVEAIANGEPLAQVAARVAR